MERDNNINSGLCWRDGLEELRGGSRVDSPDPHPCPFYSRIAGKEPLGLQVRYCQPLSIFGDLFRIEGSQAYTDLLTGPGTPDFVLQSPPATLQLAKLEIPCCGKALGHCPVARCWHWCFSDSLPIPVHPATKKEAFTCLSHGALWPSATVRLVGGHLRMHLANHTNPRGILL